MILVVAGVNPRRPVFPPIAQALAEASARRSLLADIAAHRCFSEGLLLRDGQRVELYAVAEEGVDAYDVAVDLLAGVVPVPNLAASLYFAEGADAASHLFATLCDLDEFAEGEGAALADGFARAVSEARAAGTLGGVLEGLASAVSALAGSLVVANAGESNEAVAEAAVELAKRVFGHLERRCVLAIGKNSLSAMLGEAFSRIGVDDFVFLGSADEVEEARLLGARATTPEGLAVMLGNADIVIAGGAVEGVGLDRRLMKGTARLRRGRPCLLVDVSGAGVIDRKAASIDGVFLYDADDLAAIAHDAPWAHLGAGASREKFLADATQRFARELLI